MVEKSRPTGFGEIDLEDANLNGRIDGSEFLLHFHELGFGAGR